MATKQRRYEISDTDKVIVHLPSNDGGSPKDVNMHMHGQESIADTHYGGYDRSYKTTKLDLAPKSQAVDIVIFLGDNSGIKFHVDDGANAQAGELFEMVLEQKEFPDEASEIFSLWLVSEYLEVQLEHYHIPFKLIACWEELLEKYTTATDYEQEKDEPIIMFRRNVFYSKFAERQISFSNINIEMLRLLYHEAKENVIDGRYTSAGLTDRPFHLTPPKEWFDRMAGMQAMFESEYYDETVHTPTYYRSRLHDFYPCHMRGRKWLTFSRQNEPDYRLAEAHHNQFKKWGDIRRASKANKYQFYREYLLECWKLPYYGAAFFRGQIERPGHFTNAFSADDPVWIAVNTSGAYFIDMDDNHFLMGALYCQNEDYKFTWNYGQPNATSKEHMPCIFFNFCDKETKNTQTIHFKTVQVFSTEAEHIDNLMDTCEKLMKETRTDKTRQKNYDGQLQDDVQSLLSEMKMTGFDDGDYVIESDQSIWKDFNRRALTCFDQYGNVTRTNLRNIKNKMLAS